MSNDQKKAAFRTHRNYIIGLSKWRSRLALIAVLVTVLCSLYGIVGSIVLYTENGLTVPELFRWFTTNTNCLTACAACMIIPFAVEGIRKKHFTYPKWVASLHYSGVVCAALTMVFSIAFMSWVDPYQAFGGYNTYLHIICPILVLAAFFLVESGRRYSLRDALAACIPAVIYMVVYFIEVVVIGKENGGWEDMYRVMEFMPFWLAWLAAVSLTICISLLVRRLYNRLAAFRQERMNLHLWPLDVDPLEINIEMFGLGRYMGKHADREFVELPLSLISLIAVRYGLKTEDLIRPYTRGFLDSVKDREEQQAE